MNFKLVPALLLLAPLLLPQKSFAWGWEGHSVIALIAQQVLTDQAARDPAAAKALETVKDILGETTFDQAATWADQVKSQARECASPPYVKDPEFGQGEKKGKSSAVCEAYAYTSSWHMINTDGSSYKIDPSDKDYFKGDMVVLVNGLIHVLKGEPAKVLAGVRSYDNWKQQCLKKSDHTAQSCKKEALEFLFHLVGDIHQPLHAGSDCDLGANMQQIDFFGIEEDPTAVWCTGRKPADPSDPTFPKKEAAYKSCRHHELHQAWDKNLFVHLPSVTFPGPDGYATKLLKTMASAKQSADAAKCVRVTPDAAVKVDAVNGPVDWVNESVCHVQQVYTFPDDVTQAAVKPALKTRTVAQAASPTSNRCRADRMVKVLDENGQPVQYHGKDKVDYYKPFAVGPKYLAINGRTIDERLYWGGQRLANVLKDIYGAGDKAPAFEE